MIELEAVFSISFYLTDIAENWYLLLDDNIKSSFQNLKQAFLQRFQIKKTKWFRTYKFKRIRRWNCQSIDSQNIRVQQKQKLLVKLTYMGLKPAIQQIVLPQNPEWMIS